MDHQIIYKTQAVMGIPISVPFPLQQYLLSWPQEISCYHFPFGHIIVQIYRGSRISACYYVTALKEDITIIFSSEKAIATLHCQLKNNITTRLAGSDSSIILSERSYAAYSIPAREVTESIFHSGITESFHFEFDEQYIIAIAEHYEELSGMPLSMQPDAREVYPLPSCPISFEVIDILREDIFQLVPCEILEQNIRIQAAKLLSHYRRDCKPFTSANNTANPKHHYIGDIAADNRQKMSEDSTTEYDLSLLL